ncbi:MAG: YncE family protein [Thermoplasmata archaeon]
MKPDVGAYSVLANIGVGAEPEFAAYDSANNRLYVPNWGSNTVSVVQRTAVVATVPVGTLPFSATYDPSNQMVYVVNELSNNVSVLSGTTVMSSVHVGDSPQFAVFDSSNLLVYVSNSGSANISVIRGTAVIATVPVGSDPSAPVVASSGGGGGGWDPAADSPSVTSPVIYVPNTGSNNVSMIGGATGTIVLGSIPVGTGPQFAAWDPSNDWLYVPNHGSNNVSILNAPPALTVLYNVQVGHAPWSATYDSKSLRLYVTNFGSNNLTIFQAGIGKTIVGSPTVGTGPEFATPGPGSTDTLTVPNTGSSTVSLLSGLSVVQTLRAGLSPIFATPNPVTGYTYVQNFDSSNITVIGTKGTVAVTFSESGLPSGKLWSLSAGTPLTNASNTTFDKKGTVTILAPNGTLPYAFTPPAAYGVISIVGPGAPTYTSATISGATTLVVHFGLLENVSFTEEGLPGSAIWGITLTSPLASGAPAQSSSTLGTSITLVEPHGAAFKFAITKPTTERASPRKGTIHIPEHALVKPVKFSVDSAVVHFKETGLAAHTLWGVNVTGPMAVSLTTTGTTLTFHLENGSYSFVEWNFTALHPHPAIGLFTVVVPEAAMTLHVAYTGTANPEATGAPVVGLSPSPGAANPISQFVWWAAPTVTGIRSLNV